MSPSVIYIHQYYRSTIFDANIGHQVLIGCRHAPPRRVRGSGWGSWPRVSWIQSLGKKIIGENPWGNREIHGEIHPKNYDL